MPHPRDNGALLQPSTTRAAFPSRPADATGIAWSQCARRDQACERRQSKPADPTPANCHRGRSAPSRGRRESLRLPTMPVLSRRLEADHTLQRTEGLRWRHSRNTDVITTVRSACILEIPRNGQAPAPSRLGLPRIDSRLTICRLFAVRCCVSPFDTNNRGARLCIDARDFSYLSACDPGSIEISLHTVSSRSRASSSNPVCVRRGDVKHSSRAM